MKRNHTFTLDSLQRSTPEMRKIADALQAGADGHPFNMDYFGLEAADPQKGVKLPETATAAGVALGAARFAVQTKQFPRKSHTA